MPASTSIDTGEEITLKSTAKSVSTQGTYCNEVQVVPGSDKTRSGKTAFVQVGNGGTGLCSGEAVSISKSVDSVVLLGTDTSTDPNTYSYRVNFTITVDNIGTVDLEVFEFRDLLPEGFFYDSMLTGAITDPPLNCNGSARSTTRR